MPKSTYLNLPEAKRSAITQILLEEFAAQEYKVVSISRIVERAGIAKGSFYQYFEDKADAYLFLLDLAMQEKVAFMNSAPQDPQGDLFTTLRWMMAAGTRFEFSNPLFAQIGYRAAFEDVPLPDETKQLMESGTRIFFEDQIKAGIDDGSLKPDLDPQWAAFILDATFNNLGRRIMENFEISPQSMAQKGAASFADLEIQSALEAVISILEQGFKA
jgi:AcrR family transcriptional regulator